MVNGRTYRGKISVIFLGFNGTWTWLSGSFKNIQFKVSRNSVRTLRSCYM